MRQLHVVALSEDGRSVLLASSKTAKNPTYSLPLDTKLAAALRGDLPKPGEQHVPLGVSPKEIQARLRAGESSEQIAQDAGVPVARVERFAGPVLSERERVIDEARAGYVSRSRRGPSQLPLGDAVDAALAETSGLRPDSVTWTARRLESGHWLVQVSYVARARTRTASWVYEPHTRSVTASDAASAAMGHVGDEPVPGRRAPATSYAAVPAAPAPTRAAKKPAKKKAAKKVAKKAAKKAPARTAAKAAAKAPATRKAAPKAVPRTAAAPKPKPAAKPKATPAPRPAAKAAPTKTQKATRPAPKPTAKKAAKASRSRPLRHSAAAEQMAATPVVQWGPPVEPVGPPTLRVVPPHAPEPEVGPPPGTPLSVPEPMSAPTPAPAPEPAAPEPAASEPVAPAARPEPPAVPAARQEPAAAKEPEQPPAPAATPKRRAAGERAHVPDWADVLLGITPKRSDD